jgi:hypothetical protein
MWTMQIFPLAFTTEDYLNFAPAIVIGVVAVVLLIGIARKKRRGGGGITREEAQRQMPSLREHMNVRADLERLLVDLQDLSRQLNAHIDTRFCKLEVLMKEADDKIRRLEALNGGGKSGGAISRKRAAEEETDPEKSLVYKLADAGRTPVEIAREMSKNTGEVELILSLRRSKQGQGGIDYRIED